MLEFLGHSMDNGFIFEKKIIDNTREKIIKNNPGGSLRSTS
jgi:hypothetical protein